MTRTLPGYLLDSFDVKGLSRAVNAEVSHPFIRSRNENLSSAIRLEYLNSRRNDNTTGFTVRDVMTILRANSLYQLVDRFAGANTVNVEVSKGLDTLGSTGGGSTTTTRPGANNRFVKATAEVSRVQRITDYLDFFISGSGQLASDRLFTSEQFGVGGVAYGSAYDPSEITGDDGVAGRTELRLNDPLAGLPVLNTQFYTFYDIGKVWDPGNAIASDRRSSLASAGGGVRFSINRNVSGSVEIASPLTRDVGTQNGGRRTRLFGALTAKF
jgi:hemolysin activation/secretion protein